MIEARTPRRWRARLAVVTVVAGLFATGVVATAPAVTASSVTTKAQPPKVAQLGKFAVGLRTETFVDSTRPTENVAPTRTLKTAIYYPAQGTPTDTPIANAPPETKNAPYPLILFSHGLGARGVAYENILKAWASAGYVVRSIELLRAKLSRLDNSFTHLLGRQGKKFGNRRATLQHGEVTFTAPT